MRGLLRVTSSQKNSKSTTGRLALSLFVLALAIGIFLFRQQIIDQYNVWQFKPSPVITAMADRAELSDTGKFYLYASQPVVQDRDNFNKSCTTMRGETTVVLGCYVTGKVYLFNVSDEKLDGIREVTAAHEMLHAVYERLSNSERARIDALLQAESQKITDPNFVSLMKEYDKAEPGERNNELHSIIATQVRDISPELESYYARYFDNRASVVALYVKYASVFSSVRIQQALLSSELDALVQQIDIATNSYNQGVTKLNSDVETFNRRARGGEFSSQAQFNSERDVLLLRQQRLVSDRALIDGYIATYNTKRQQLSEINNQAEALNRSINSNLNPLPSI